MNRLLNLGNRIVNNWLYEGPSGLVLIDTGYDTGYQRLRRKLTGYGILLADIRYIFLTHVHDDHAGFLNDVLRDSPDAKVIMSPKAPRVLRQGQHDFNGGCTARLALLFCKFMELIGRGEHRFPPLAAEFEGRCILVCDENRAELEKLLGGVILETPGHTADSISLFLEDGTLFCGDAAMNGLPSLHRITIWAEDRQQFLQSWQAIIAARPRMIYPGHGSPFPWPELERNLEQVMKMRLHPLKRQVKMKIAGEDTICIEYL